MVCDIPMSPRNPIEFLTKYMYFRVKRRKLGDLIVCISAKSVLKFRKFGEGSRQLMYKNTHSFMTFFELKNVEWLLEVDTN